MFKIEIKTDGAAFHCEDPEENPALDREVLRQEVSRILVKIATNIGYGGNGGPVMDLNGNKVGEWSLE